MQRHLNLSLLAAVFIIACGGEEKKSAVSENSKQTVEVSQYENKEGKKVYDQYCLSCHQAQGTGVPNLNPPLKATDYVLGDKQRLIGIVLKGSNEGLNINGMTYSNAMPPHNFLSDQEIAQVLSYVRNSFGNQADTVAAEEVKKVREALK